MKTTLTALAFALLSTAASAFPAHQFDGFRDIGGCDASTRVAITNDAGEVLYWNMQCPGKLPGNRTADIAEAKAREEANTPAS